MRLIHVAIFVVCSLSPQLFAADSSQDERLREAIRSFEEAVERERALRGDQVRQDVRRVEGGADTHHQAIDDRVRTPGSLLVRSQHNRSMSLPANPPAIDPPAQRAFSPGQFHEDRPHPAMVVSRLPPVPDDLTDYDGIPNEILEEARSQLGMRPTRDGMWFAPLGTFEAILHHSWLSILQPDFDGPEFYPEELHHVPPRVQQIERFVMDPDNWASLDRATWLRVAEVMMRHAESQIMSEFYYRMLQTPIEHIHESQMGHRNRYSIAAALQIGRDVQHDVMDKVSRTSMTGYVPSSPIDAALAANMANYQDAVRGVLANEEAIDYLQFARDWELYWTELLGSDAPKP